MIDPDGEIACSSRISDEKIDRLSDEERVIIVSSIEIKLFFWSEFCVKNNSSELVNEEKSSKHVWS